VSVATTISVEDVPHLGGRISGNPCNPKINRGVEHLFPSQREAFSGIGVGGHIDLYGTVETTPRRQRAAGLDAATRCSRNAAVMTQPDQALRQPE
jgi:hypothetical protein